MARGKDKVLQVTTLCFSMNQSSRRERAAAFKRTRKGEKNGGTQYNDVPQRYGVSAGDAKDRFLREAPGEATPLTRPNK